MREPKRKKQDFKCNQKFAEHTKGTQNNASRMKHIIRGLLVGLCVLIVLCANTVRVSSMEKMEEKGVQPKLSIREEINSLQNILENEFCTKESDYALSLLRISNPELLDRPCHLGYIDCIYRKKEHVEIDVSKCRMENILYKLAIPHGVRSLRILDSSHQDASRKQHNRVFVKLLYSLRNFTKQSLIIENIRIGSDEEELVNYLGVKLQNFKVKKLVFRKATTQTIQVFFKRLGNISIGRLCIEGCGELQIDDAVILGRKYETDELEFTDIKIAKGNYKKFLQCVKHIKHLRMYKVEFMSMQEATKDQELIEPVASLLHRLAGTLEIDRDVYDQVPVEIWDACTDKVVHLHFMDTEDSDIFPCNHAFNSFASIETLTLTVVRPEPLSLEIVFSLVEYAVKNYGNAKNVVVRGRIDMEDVKSVLCNKKSTLYITLKEHADKHFTFADSTDIDLNRKHLLFILFSIYNEATGKELRRKLGALGEMSNWEWNQQEEPEKRCERCMKEKRKEVYVTNVKDKKIYCIYHTLNNIQKQDKSTAADNNIQVRNIAHVSYLRHAIFLYSALGNRVYLTETRDILETAIKQREEARKSRKRTVEGIICSQYTKNALLMQDSPVNLSMPKSEMQLQVGSSNGMGSSQQLLIRPC